MKPIRSLIYLILVCTCLFSCEKKGNPEYLLYKNRAETFFDTIYHMYKIPEHGLFSEFYPTKNQPNVNYFNDGEKQSKEVSYLWPFSGMASAVNILYKIDSVKYKGYLEEIINAQELYLDTTRKPAGYQAYPAKFEKVDRYYDDNGLVGIDYIEAYANTKNPVYLERAKGVFTFIMSGWDFTLEGGVSWLEGVRDQKPACSNGKATVLALKIYEQTHDEYYLNKGLDFYNWMFNHLRDSSCIYWNDMKTADRSILQTAWTYNTGTMLQAAVSLYKITGEKAYLVEAQRLAEGSYKHFGQKKDDGRVSILDMPWFVTVLFRGYQDLYEVDKNPKYIDTIITNLNYAWEHARDQSGLVYNNWNAEADESKNPKWLLDEACIAELYARIALIKQSEGN